MFSSDDTNAITVQIELMKKPEFVTEMAAKAGLTKVQTEQAIAAFWETVADAVIDGRKVTFTGYGTFEPRTRAARQGRNPQSGAPLEIAESRSPAFSASKVFKERVNSSK